MKNGRRLCPKIGLIIGADLVDMLEFRAKREKSGMREGCWQIGITREKSQNGEAFYLCLVCLPL
jgi:hypothetical protein